MAKHTEHFFMCLLAICISFENCLFCLFAYLLIRLFVLLLFSFLSSLYILDINPLSVELLVKIFSSSVSYLLILIIISFDVQNFL
jgi:hypothetical protein